MFSIARMDANGNSKITSSMPLSAFFINCTQSNWRLLLLVKRVDIFVCLLDGTRWNWFAESVEIRISWKLFGF